MTRCTGAIDDFQTTRVSGALQLELYAAVQNLLLDRIVWFWRNMDLPKGSCPPLVDHYRTGVEAMEAALPACCRAKRWSRAMPASVRCPRRKPVSAKVSPAVSAHCRCWQWRRTSAVADRTGKPVADVVATYSPARAYFQLDRIVGAARDINVADYIRPLALESRARRHRCSRAPACPPKSVANGAAGPAAVEAWATRQSQVNRIRARSTRLRGPASRFLSPWSPRAFWATWSGNNSIPCHQVGTNPRDGADGHQQVRRQLQQHPRNRTRSPRGQDFRRGPGTAMTGWNVRCLRGPVRFQIIICGSRPSATSAPIDKSNAENSMQYCAGSRSPSADTTRGR